MGPDCQQFYAAMWLLCSRVPLPHTPTTSLVFIVTPRSWAELGWSRRHMYSSATLVHPKASGKVKISGFARSAPRAPTPDSSLATALAPRTRWPLDLIFLHLLGHDFYQRFLAHPTCPRLGLYAKWRQLYCRSLRPNASKSQSQSMTGIMSNKI